MEKYGRLEVNWAQGYKGDDIFHINSDTIFHACGNTVCFFDIEKDVEETFDCTGRGVRAIAANPFQSVFAVAEQGLNPKIYIHQYPSYDEICALEGAELEYTNLAFSYSKHLIAATSGLPDFTLFLWNWCTGELQCSAKLLNEESITSLLFNPMNQNHISLIGPDKVTVWTIENCNDVSSLKSKKIELPSTDGVTMQEEDHGVFRSVTRSGYSLQIPLNIKSGLVGEKAVTFEPAEVKRPRVNPSAHCWSHRGQVYVGCQGGQLFSVDVESGKATLVFDAENSNNLIKGEIEPGMFNCMALNSQGIYAGGADGFIRLITINNKNTKIEKVWKTEDAYTSLSFQPKDYAFLIYGTADGVIYRHNLKDKGSIAVCESHSKPIVGVDYAGGGTLCVTCREDGDVQVWSTEDGNLNGSLRLQDKVSSMVYCPSCPVLAVGTSQGLIRYVDMTSLHSDEIEMREIFIQKMHHAAVDFVKYDSFGIFLLSASKEENEIFVYNAKPSTQFQCVGYVDCKGKVQDLSIFTQGEESHIVALISSGEKESKQGDLNQVIVFSLTPGLMDGDGSQFASSKKDFKEEKIKLSRFFLSKAIESVVITGVSDMTEIAAVSRHSKKVLKFHLFPSQEEQEDLCSPVSEHPGHDLDKGFLTLSPHRGWLASSSRDGNILIRDLKDWNSCVKVNAHSFMDGGTRKIAFSPDSKMLVSIGANDNCLSGFSWNFTEKGSIQASYAVEFSRALNMRLRNTMETESEVLDEMRDLHATASDLTESKGSDVPAEEKKKEFENLADAPTWLDRKKEAALQEENSKYDSAKESLRSNIAELRNTILTMMEVNQNLPEMEQLRQEEYNLDTDEQKRMQAQQDHEVEQVRQEINIENLAQRYLAYLIKKECWDDMETKGRGLKTFNQSVTVHNYPTLAPSEEEEKFLQAATRLRKVEIAENLVRRKIVDVASSKTSVVAEEEEEEDADQSVALALHGSLGPKYNGDNDLFYSQFDLHTQEQKMIQISLIKNAIRRIKTAFNESFNSVYRNKEQEITRIKERNVRIRTILEEIGHGSGSVADPELDDVEMPEKGFVVRDEEVTVERVLSEDQKREKEQQERMEEERKAAAKGDNKRERALMDMMGGVLEVKKEDMLKQDLPPPDFSQERSEKDWTEDEKKKWKEFEKKQKELQDEREKYRKNLENELKKLQQINLDGMASYDETVNSLFNKKVKVEMVVNQEELKVLRLTLSLVIDNELSTHEAHLNYLQELKNYLQSQAALTESQIRKKVDEYREVYDSVAAEDKMLDRGFKRDFADIPLSLSDQLFKLFRRRPRIHRQQKHVADGVTSFDPYGIADKIAHNPHDGDHTAAFQALAELDNPSHMPEGLEEHLWERLCEARRVKYESELRVKQSAKILAEMTQYQQNRQDELERLNREIDDVAKQQVKLYEDVMKNDLNLEIQLLLKQGQVEVASGQFIPDFSDSILIHRGVVEDLNGTIRGLGENKVAAMNESKDFKKNIHQLDWDRKRMNMQMEDLNNKARHIQMLKLTKEIQTFLNEDNHSAKQAKEISVLEQTLVLLDKQLDKQTAHKNDATTHLIRRIRTKEEENKELDKLLEELHISVSERFNISEVNAAERAKHTADKRLRGIVQRRKLVDLAKAQAQEVAVLRAEVERLRMKTFPALVQVER